MSTIVVYQIIASNTGHLSLQAIFARLKLTLMVFPSLWQHLHGRMQHIHLLQV